MLSATFAPCKMTDAGKSASVLTAETCAGANYAHINPNGLSVTDLAKVRRLHQATHCVNLIKAMIEP